MYHTIQKEVIMSSKEYDYVVTVTEDNFFMSDSLTDRLPEKFFESHEDEDSNETKLGENVETQVHLNLNEEDHVGKLVSFEVQSSQTVLCFEIKKTSGLQFISGKRFESVTIRHGEIDLWSSEDVPKLKDTVSVDLNGQDALVTLTVRKIAYTERHK